MDRQPWSEKRADDHDGADSELLPIPKVGRRPPHAGESGFTLLQIPCTCDCDAQTKRRDPAVPTVGRAVTPPARGEAPHRARVTQGRRSSRPTEIESVDVGLAPSCWNTEPAGQPQGLSVTVPDAMRGSMRKRTATSQPRSERGGQVADVQRKAVIGTRRRHLGSGCSPWTTGTCGPGRRCSARQSSTCRSGRTTQR